MMVTITIDYGDGTGSKLEIANDRTGTKALGNYDVRLEQYGQEVTRFRIEQFPRWMGIEYLASKALFDFSMALDAQNVPGTDVEYGGATPEHAPWPIPATCPICGGSMKKVAAKMAEKGE